MAQVTAEQLARELRAFKTETEDRLRALEERVAAAEAGRDATLDRAAKPKS